jgi:ABC-2 type transport system permease protein
MRNDILTVIWKESREFIGQQNKGNLNLSWKGIGVMFLIIGVFIPWRSGPGFLTQGPGLFLVAWLPLFMAIQITTDAVAGERERHTLETLLSTRLSDSSILLGKMLSSFLFTWCMLIGLLVTQLITINLTHREDGLIILSARMGAGLAVFSALLYGLACSAGVLVSLHASSARQAAQTLALSITAVFIGVTFGFRALPDDWRRALAQAISPENQIQTAVIAALVLIAFNVLLFALARLRFQRARLILD